MIRQTCLLMLLARFSAPAACHRAPTEPEGGEVPATPEEERAFDRRLAQFDVLLSDIRHPPIIEAVDAADYSGQAGQPICIIARDDFAVTRVQVRLERLDGSVVEEGDAVAQPGSLRWTYAAQLTNPGYADHILHVLVADRPGNLTETVQKLD